MRQNTRSKNLHEDYSALSSTFRFDSKLKVSGDDSQKTSKERETFNAKISQRAPLTDKSKSIPSKDKRNEMLNKLGMSKDVSDNLESDSNDMIWNFIQKFESSNFDLESGNSKISKALNDIYSEKKMK